MDVPKDRYDNDVFISYSQHQRRAAELVRDVLRKNLLTCWIAPECIPAGSDYTTEIPRAIHGCKVLVLILSSDAQRSRWVRSEVNNAIRENKIIIPFAIQNCKIDRQFDFAISKSQRIVAYKNLSAALEQLVQAVYALVQKQLVPVQQEYLKKRIRLYRRRRVILTLTAILLAAAVFTASAFLFSRVLDTEHEPGPFYSGTIGSCEWRYDEQNAVLTVFGTGSTYVNGTSSPWAEHADTIRTLIVEEGVRDLGYSLMSDCTALTRVSLPDSLVTIYGGVFMNCTALEDITLPEGLSEIGLYAFTGCKSLNSVRIPASVENLNPLAFSEAGLSEFVVDPANENYCSVDGVLFDKSMTRLISFPCGYPQMSYIVPDGVTIIGDRAFESGSSLRTVEMPDTVTEIGERSFYRCSALTRIVFSQQLTAIGKRAFADCNSLSEVALPESLSSLGEEAFSLCLRLKKVDLATHLQTIEKKTFFGCSHLVDVTLGEHLKKIGSAAFHNCSELKRLAVPASVSRIEDDAFEGCGHLTLVGGSGSEAQRYAEANGFLFEAE